MVAEKIVELFMIEDSHSRELKVWYLGLTMSLHLTRQK